MALRRFCPLLAALLWASVAASNKSGTATATSALGARSPVPAPGPGQNAGFVSFPISKSQRGPGRGRPSKRNGDTPLYNEADLSYVMELSIGTPGQTVRVAIDTGSNELWVDPDCTSTSLSTTQAGQCNSNGRYDPGASHTSASLSKQNEIPYGRGDVAINYYADTIVQPNNNMTLTNVTFGVATRSWDLDEGILGLGWGEGKNTDYRNFLDELVAQGLIGAKAFSVALGSADENTEEDGGTVTAGGGTITFGGIDTRKFSGGLATLPVLPSPKDGDEYRYWVQLDSVSLTRPASGTKTYSEAPMPVVVDSGSSLSYLPPSIVSAMAKDLSGVYDSTVRGYAVPCDAAEKAGEDGSTVDFSLGGGRITVSVPLAHFLWHTGGFSNSGLGPEPLCVLGAAPVADGLAPVLGDSFLRSAYVVFDQDANALYMAPYVDCGRAEQAIAPGANVSAAFAGECPASAVPKQKSAAGAASLGETRELWVGMGVGIVAALGAQWIVGSLLL